jgi:S-DNA-T family DNA segregation ATPase FtsK/SpoIIIE
MTTTAIATPDPEDYDARVFPFPTTNAPASVDSDPADATEPMVVDGEVEYPTAIEADPGEVVTAHGLVDAPELAPDRSVSGWLERARVGQRREVVPPWLRRRSEFGQTVKWVAAHAGHITAFHTVRIPWYVAKVTARAPRGALRALVTTARWAVDDEGRALRASAVQRGDADLYLKLQSQRPKYRVWLVLAGLALVTAGALVLFGYTPWWAQTLAMSTVVGLLGWAGTNPDRPVIGGRAVVTSKAQKLTSDIVVRALSALGIAEVNKAVGKGGRGITFPSPITRDGPGWRAEVDLPYGVVVTDIMERRDKLASGLRRPLGCVWPEPVATEHSGRLVLWVGDQDMSQAKPAAWPLAKTGKADIFTPLPFGQDQRGRMVSFLLMFANLLIGAMPRQGKTFALRIVLLAAALDPTVQLRIFELKGTGDLSGPGEKCAHHYGTGADDDTLQACLDSLREIKTELDTRAKTIRELPREVCPENKVTPELARRKGLGLHPVVFAIDECQELFSHPELGKEATDLCVPIIKRGPALGIMLVLATQRPDAKSLPPAVADNMSLRFCLRVMGQVANDMVLGTSAYKNGTRATMFGHKDKGIGLLVGNADDPQIVRSAYVDGPDADRIADRARAMRAAAGTLTGYAAGEDTTLDRDTGPNLLADVVQVLPAGEDKVWSETVVARLAELRPEIYGPWAEQDGKTKATQLAAALKPYGITTSQVWATGPDGKPGNRRGITRTDILTAHQKINGE